MSHFKTPRIDSKQYRAGSNNNGWPCAHCGDHSESVVPAHYSGMHANKLGKGSGYKADDIFIADLCHQCHSDFDSYVNGRDEKAGFDFLMAICVTQRRRYEMGLLTIKGG